MMALGCIRETSGCGYQEAALRLLIGETKVAFFSPCLTIMVGGPPEEEVTG